MDLVEHSEGIYSQEELIVKGPSVMLGYYENEEATKEVLIDGQFYTGDLAKIDEEGYIYICGRKKSVIVLKNRKNIFPEEMKNLVNKIERVKEFFIYGKQQSSDKNDIKINVQIVFDRKIVEDVYKVQNDDEIYKVLSLFINNTPFSLVLEYIISLFFWQLCRKLSKK